MFLSSGQGYIGELLELPQGCHGPFRGSRGKVRFLWKHRSGIGPHLALRGHSPGFSPVAAAHLGFHSSSDGDIRDPIVSPQESPVSMRVAGGLSGFLCSRCWVEVLIWSGGRILRFPLQFRHGSRRSSGVSTGKPGLILCGNMEVLSSLQLEKQLSGFLSC